MLSASVQSCVKNCVGRFWELWGEMLHHSAFLVWAAEHFEGDSRDLVGVFYALL